MGLLSSKERDAVFQIIELYILDPYHESLMNHPLREWDLRIRSIRVESDIRIILRDRWDASIFLMDVWDHKRVYSD